MPRNEDSFILEDSSQAKDFIAHISTNMYEYMERKINSRFIVFYKYLTHSDLATFGKATHPNSHDKNFLYYISTSEMLEIEKKTGKPFQTAHQSCIGLKKELYKIVGLPDPRNVSPYLINDYMNVRLVNDNLEYFSSKYTKSIFNKLNRKIEDRKSKSWNFEDLNIELEKGLFTSINLHVAVHGLGMEQDTDFHKLRHHMFKGDTFILLFEIGPNEKNMFILLEKNPIFFSLLGITNKAYEDYQIKLRNRIITQVTNKQNSTVTPVSESTKSNTESVEANATTLTITARPIEANDGYMISHQIASKDDSNYDTFFASVPTIPEIKGEN